MRHCFPKLNMRRMLALLFAVVTLLSTLPQAIAVDASGECGDSLTWDLKDGTLIIRGTGDMTDYSEEELAPWYEFREEIIRLELPDGLVRIGDMAFYQCDNLTNVIVPNSVQVIGKYAFAECTSMQTLQLGSNLKRIGESAFSSCETLNAIALPESLNTIERQAFYRCASLSYIRVPISVTEMGTSVFAYCSSLTFAELLSYVEVIPDWTFYGCNNLNAVVLSDGLVGIDPYAFRECDNLNVVYYGGVSMTKEQIQRDLGQQIPAFSATGSVSSDDPSDSFTTTITQENGDGTITSHTTRLDRGNGSDVVSKITNTRTENVATGGSYKTDISVLIDKESGWEDASNAVDRTVSSLSDRAAEGAQVDAVEVTVYVKNETELDSEFVNSLAGRNVVLNVVTEDGSRWTIDCTQLNSRELSDAYSLAYSQSAASNEECEQMKVENGYKLLFMNSAQVNSKLTVRLSVEHSQKTATLYQWTDDAMQALQTVLVDRDGFVQFYLASVDDDIEYFIGIDSDDVSEENAIIPESMMNEYGVQEQFQPLEYVITGRKSSWNMDIGQVTWIMVGVLLGSVALIGVVLFLMNKRKLRKGYVVDLDEYETADL